MTSNSINSPSINPHGSKRCRSFWHWHDSQFCLMLSNLFSGCFGGKLRFLRLQGRSLLVSKENCSLCSGSRFCISVIQFADTGGLFKHLEHVLHRLCQTQTSVFPCAQMLMLHFRAVHSYSSLLAESFRARVFVCQLEFVCAWWKNLNVSSIH